MTETAKEIADILLHCEENGSAPPYVCSETPKHPNSLFDSAGPKVEISADGAEIFVVSDLHLATGVGADGRYEGCENFYYDSSFRRFLDRAHRDLKADRALLIINGDFIDFLRITYVPGREERSTRWARFLKQIKINRRERRIETLSEEQQREFMKDFIAWQRVIKKVGIEKSAAELIHSISDKEEIYGLRTNDYKSLLRLDIVLRGHREFFDALARWLERGHRIIIVKGNHDLEWYWLAVRNYLRLDLAERLARMRFGNAATDQNSKDTLLTTVLPGITFIDHAMLIDGDFYVEHGHLYDPLTRVIGEDTVGDGQELNIPFGSFFNRYLLNFIESDYPYLDNIRPTKNILPMMLRQQFLAGLRLLIDHLIVIIRTIPRQYISYIFGQHIIGRVLLIVLAILVPAGLMIWRLTSSALPAATRVIEIGLWLVAIYAIIQVAARVQLSEPDSLAKFARNQFEKNSGYRLITFGHTHNPDQFAEGERWFYNTGTWISIVETTTASLRADRTFMYLHLTRDAAGKLRPGVLQRWDDAAERSEPVVITKGVEA